jgi:hypothetical protein
VKARLIGMAQEIANHFLELLQRTHFLVVKWRTGSTVGWPDHAKFVASLAFSKFDDPTLDRVILCSPVQVLCTAKPIRFSHGHFESEQKVWAIAQQFHWSARKQSDCSAQAEVSETKIESLCLNVLHLTNARAPQIMIDAIAKLRMRGSQQLKTRNTIAVVNHVVMDQSIVGRESKNRIYCI